MAENWYRMATEDVYTKLKSSPEGISGQSVKDRQQKYGMNELDVKTTSPLVRFLLQFHNPLLYILLIAAVVAYFLDKILDMWVILAVVLATAVIGYIQEGKAESAIGALRSMLAPESTVIRDGRRLTIPGRELVPGDLVILEAGDKVPADLRLVEAKNLALDESALTGESVAAGKQSEPLEGDALELAERKNMAYSGTGVARGVGKGIVVATATRTEMGKISEYVSDPKKSEPPIMRKIREFTKAILAGILILGIINLFFGIRYEYEIGFLFLVSVGLIVAMVPEGLPAALVAAFSFGVTKMAKCGALVRKLPAVETLGTTTVICSDKTGTLTRNEMTVKSIYTAEGAYRVSGSGYSLSGEFTEHAGGTAITVEDNTSLGRLLIAGIHCNNAELDDSEENGKINGDPTEGALLVAAAKTGIKADMKRLDEIPFESELQYMATLHERESENILFVKGAPEKIISLCDRQLANGEEKPLAEKPAYEAAEEMAGDALRVLGFAQKLLPSSHTEITEDDLRGMTFLGLQGMIDPPRDETAEAVRQCRDAGIRIVMITGDHAATARAIADMLEIGKGEEQAVTGREVEAMDDDELYDVVAEYSVFARTSPEHKFRIVRQLQRRGEIVAVTGDGVNDAPALANADIGIAMGITGTQVSKDAADIVLTDDNFATIVRAVEEGRHAFNNIWKVILFLLPANGGEGLSILAAILLSPFLPVFSSRLPVEPIHILWVNLIMSITCAIPLTREPMEPGLLQRPPREPKEKLVNPVFIRKVSLVSLVSAGAAITMFLLYCRGAFCDPTETVFVEAQTVAFTTIIFVELYYLFTSRWINDSAFSHNPLSNKLLVGGVLVTIALQVLIVYSEPLFGFSPLRTSPFPPHVWLYILAIASPGMLIIELEKHITKHRRKAA